MLHLSHAYIYEHVLRPLDSYPWALAAPDSLQVLQAMDTAPDEPFASRVYHLLHAGGPS